MTKLTCEQFYDKHFERELDDMIQEAYYEGGLNTNRAWEDFLASAADLNIELIDADSFNSDKFFWNCYQCAEKGLS